MALDSANFIVKDISIGSHTELKNQILTVNPNGIRDIVLKDSYFTDVTVEVVHPGDNTRIINILDVVEPRHKISGPGYLFPGVLAPHATTGSGMNQTLKGMTVILVGEPAPGESVHWRDGIIDMWGQGAEYSEFSKTINLIVHLKGKKRLSSIERKSSEPLNALKGSKYSQDHNNAARLIGFEIANYLASNISDSVPDTTESWNLATTDSLLPKVAYTFQIQYHKLYGAQVGWQPTLIHPNDFFDGAMYISFMDVASNRQPTITFQNHPLLKELYRNHGVTIDFRGVLIYPNAGHAIPDKERITGFSAKILNMLRINGVVMTWNGGGHPGIDIMMLCKKCELSGISTTLISPQMSQSDNDPGFVHYVPEATAIVNSGNYEEPITLPAADKVLGGTHLSVPPVDASQSLNLTTKYLYAATSPLGATTLSNVLF